MTARTGYGNFSIDAREEAAPVLEGALTPVSPEARILEKSRSMGRIADSD